MQTVTMRLKSINLRTLGNTAFGSVCGYAPISLLDNDYRFDESISKIFGRLRC